MLRAVYGNDTLHLPASSLGTFLLLDCAVSAGLDLNGKSRDSCLSSGAHLTSHVSARGQPELLPWPWISATLAQQRLLRAETHLSRGTCTELEQSLAPRGSCFCTGGKLSSLAGL